MKGTPAQRMLALFKSNERSSGRFDPKTGKMFTEYRGLEDLDFNKHLNGEQGIGAVPITDADTCYWAAIDIDNHGQDEDIPIAPIDEKIILHRLPALGCRSKSGGVHVYAFFEKARPAAKVRAILSRWAGLLGYPKAEIFPRQARLLGEPGKKQLGNWINLPYLSGDATQRYAFHSGKKLSLESFIAKAESIRINDADLAAAVLATHPQAPPCVQRMMIEGVPSGKRNEALFNATVYFRKFNPAESENYASSFNIETFDKPLGKVEFSRTVASANRPDYQYRCNEEPIRSFCDRAECIKRQFGITPAQGIRVEEIGGLPTFSDLVKYSTEPTRWAIQIDGIRVVNIATESLLEWQRIRVVIAEQLTRVVPMLKNAEWERILQPLMSSARVETVPDDASMTGVIRERLREFSAKVKYANGVGHGNGKVEAEDRAALLRGLPVIADVDGEKLFCFRAQDFINYLKRTRAEEMKGSNLWFALEPMGIESRRIRVNASQIIRVWCIPWIRLEDQGTPKIEIPRPEL